MTKTKTIVVALFAIAISHVWDGRSARLVNEGRSDASCITLLKHRKCRMFNLLKTFHCALIVGVLLVQCITHRVEIVDSDNAKVDLHGGSVGAEVIISLDPNLFADLYGGQVSEILAPSGEKLDNLANLLESGDMNSEEINALKRQLKDCRSSLARCKIVSNSGDGIVEPSDGKTTPKSPVIGPYSHGAISVSPPPPKCSLGIGSSATLELAISQSLEGCRGAGGTQCSLLVSWTNECVAVAAGPTCELYHAVGKDLSDLEQRVLSRCREFHEECLIPEQASFCTQFEGG